MMDTDNTKRLAELFCESRENRDPQQLRSILSEDVEWILPRSMGDKSIVGSTDVVSGLVGGVASKVLDVSSIQRRVRSIITEGEKAAIQLSLSATRHDGGRYENEYCWILTCRRGQICKLEEYVDTRVAQDGKA